MSTRPYRLVVCTTIDIPASKRKGAQLKTVGCAFMGWTADQTAEPWRLPGSGTFLFAGLHKVRQAAMAYLAEPRTHQVQVRTNQDRTVYVWNKWAAGRITGYMAGEA